MKILQNTGGEINIKEKKSKLTWNYTWISSSVFKWEIFSSAYLVYYVSLKKKKKKYIYIYIYI